MTTIKKIPECRWPKDVEEAFDAVGEHLDMIEDYMNELYDALEKACLQ
ncbi:hypothetical protein LCGC14_1990330 [marine sediment metagenome]|uniref:Uncharacterized protein n=1 Tax=marine sediment metagenome TaxID=412755 RepID=A0A0F9HJM0_9ZZZZ